MVNVVPHRHRETIKDVPEAGTSYIKSKAGEGQTKKTGPQERSVCFVSRLLNIT